MAARTRTIERERERVREGTSEKEHNEIVYIDCEYAFHVNFTDVVAYVMT